VAEEDPPPTSRELARLLPLALAEAAAPVEELARRLEMPDGAAWLEAALATGPWGAREPLAPRLAGGAASLDELTALKSRANERVRKPASLDDALRALAVYFLAVAAAQVHHAQRITSQPRAEVDRALLRLAAAAPPPWAELLRRAARGGGGSGEIDPR
jgi:hypothetical protein